MRAVSHSLSRRQLAIILVVLFVLASVMVGYVSQVQTLATAGPSGYNVIGGPAVPRVQQQVMSFTYSNTVASVTAPSGSYSTSFGGRMVELEGYITIQVADAKAASDQAARLAASLDGYVASSSFEESSSSMSMVLRVPESNFSLAMRNLSAMGIVKDQSISSNDVTEQYVDLQAQLDSYKTEENALLRILNASTSVRDALDAENAIQNTQAQINDLEGQLRVMQRLVTFATINIQLNEPAKSPTLDFAEALNSALLAFYTIAKGMLILGASLVPIAVVGGMVYIPYKHFTRKKPEPIEAK
jgi:hypothetical protein